ncbi:adenosine deaminase/editase [Mycena sp. CBHHK59/15]|nr:adenosine deaminase/editase [Mycena sp. CBHHK59/15]
MENEPLPVGSFIESIVAVYHSLRFQPPAQQYTILASLVLAETHGQYKILSVATGTKCLPTNKLPSGGESVHDSHAEVLARRGAMRWFLEEVGRCCGSANTPFQSDWIFLGTNGRYTLKDGAQLVLFISTVPCGDASMRFLASSQDEQMAALKDSTIYPPADPNSAARGRDNYSLWGVLRTKPGRADSPPTTSMSCSDKIAAWNFLGIQGALGSRFLRPLYISRVIIGEVPADMQNVVREDCERALWGRLGSIPDSGDYALHRPMIQFTSVPFVHSRTTIASTALQVGGSCNDSLWWIADSAWPHEVLINGLKRGVSPKHRHREKSRQGWPQACKISLLQLYHETLHLCGLPPEPDGATYLSVKQSMMDYQVAKLSLLGEGASFCGWIRGPSPQNFSSRAPAVHTT